MTVDGAAVLEPGAPVVWFTFPGARHDIGRFHTRDGRFTGCYADILTPIELQRGPDGVDGWRTTDLFLDVFLSRTGEVRLLDRNELEAAVARGWVDGPTARTAEEEADRLMAAARAGRWPPPVVDAWPLERARAVAGTG